MDPTATTTRPVGPDEADSPTSSSGFGPESSTPTTPTNPTGPSQVFTGEPSAFEGLFTAAVGLGGSLIDDRLSPESHAWMPTQEEAASIAGPLARIAARHTPAVAGQEASDILDGLEAGVAAVGYGIRAHTDAKRYAVYDQQHDQNNPQQ